MLDWLRRRRRQKILAQQVPAHWQPWLQRLWFWSTLAPEERAKLADLAKVFVAEKNWEGCGGLAMQDEIQVTIAAQMAWLVLGLPDQYFDRVLSILVYPDAYLAPEVEPTPGGVVLHGEAALEGQAWYRGPVILSWRDVRRGGQGNQTGRNVVLHEFAHQLDMLNGAHVDGVPVIDAPQFAERWLQVTRRAFRDLQRRCDAGFHTVLDCYGATSPEEFFAVATEAFFQRAPRLQAEDPELYAVLAEFYRQDPAGRVTARP